MYEDVFIVSSYLIDNLTECRAKLEIIFFQNFEVIAAKNSRDILTPDCVCVILFDSSWKHLEFYLCILKFQDDILWAFSAKQS